MILRDPPIKLTRGLYNWRSRSEGCVATIGNFDGMHRGHARIFDSLTNLSTEYQLPSLVISFEPLPHEFFTPESASLRLQTFRDRVRFLHSASIDELLLLRFDQSFANQAATDFIEKTLIEKLNVRHLLIGDDFRFGKGRLGDISLLREYQQAGKFTVSETPTVEAGGTRISSTRIREQMMQFDCAGANELLGRPHRISGRVSKGAQLGRTLGFPTANVGLKSHRPLLRGVFAVETHWNGKRYPSVANLGERPTVDGKKLLLEVHLFDQAVDLYGEYLAIDFHQHIRGERKFESLDELKDAITNDARIARDYFNC